MSRIGDIFDEICQPALAEHLGETVSRYPLGVVLNAVSVPGVIVDLSAEIGTNQESGDGVVLDDRFGERVRRSGMLEVPASVTVDERDTWLVRGEVWYTRRIMARDESIQTVLIVRKAAGGKTVRSRLQRG